MKSPIKLTFFFSFLFLLGLGCNSEPEEPFSNYAPYNRAEVSGTEGAVVSGHPLATAAGHKVLLEGGNATDAAVTMAGVLAVVRPHMNGIGGDAFGLIYDAEANRVDALNGSGRSGSLADPDFFDDNGLEEIPDKHGASVTVPGAVSAWAEVLDRHGTIELSEALEPAIKYANEGFPVTPTLVRDFNGNIEDLNEAGQDIYFNDGEPFKSGEILQNPALARTLETVANEGPSAFYGGSIGQQIASFVEEEGGYLRIEDFEKHEGSWGTSLQAPFQGKTVHAFPPNSQGIALPMQLGMSEELDLGEMDHNSSEYLHTLIELKKLAFADRDRWVADPATNPPVDKLLEQDYLVERSRLIQDEAGRQVAPGFDESEIGSPAEGDGDTVYLMAVDKEGNGVSWIQSNFASFGSGLVEPETGIVLQNRGAGFTLQENHPNRIQPDKRPFHTLSPAMITDEEGQLDMTIGTPGGHGQTQFITQVLHNLFTFGMEPQEAVESPRFRSYDSVSVSLESRIGPEVRDELRQKGHDLRIIDDWSASFGGVQLISINGEDGILRTAADPRREGYGLAW